MSMTGYTKLFGSIITSTIWGEDNVTRIVWITMLALKNRDNVVEGSIPGLAAMARVTVLECEEALNKLLAEDKYSRSKQHDGRRIECVDGGWFILNGERYRDKLNADERREYFRLKQQEGRAKKKGVACQISSNESLTCQTMSTPSTHADSRVQIAEAEEEPLRAIKPSSRSQTLLAEEIYAAYPRKVGKPVALRAILKAFEQIEPAKLLEITKQFAAARNGDVEFCPHPSTFYNQERWNDDPETWKPQQPNIPGKPLPGKSLEERISNDATRTAFRIIDEFHKMQILQDSAGDQV